MQISRPDPQTLQLSQINGFLCDLLERIVPSADPSGSEAAQARLFSPPTQDADEADFAEDWREYVQPGMRHIFQSALAVIAGDLADMRVEGPEEERALTIPVDHLERWIHGLNQSRLALAARHGFTEEDMEGPPSLAGDARAFALVQIRFYGILEELLLSELDEI